MSQPNSNFLKGVAFAKAQNYSEALKSFTSAIEEHPNKFTSYLNRGSIECCLGLDQFAIEDFNKVVELEPYEITGYYNRFISFYKTGKKLQARHDLYVALSLAYMKKGEELRQVGLIGKALDIVENNSLALIKRGNLYKQQGNIQMAINDYTGALDADDKNLVALTLRAPLLKNTGRQQEAEEDVQRIAELTSNYEKNKIVLFPRINTLTPSQIETDIQNKVKQFTSLRNQIFKKGLEQSIRNQANETKQKPKSTNKLQTTLGQRAEQVVDPQRIQKASNKDSLGHLADFVQSSQNVNSSNQMLNESCVERKQYRAIPSNVLTEDAGASNTSVQTPSQHIQYSYQQSKQRTNKPTEGIEDESNQNITKNNEHKNDQQDDNQHQNYTVQVIQTSQSRQNRQQPTEQTGDDMYGVEPQRQSRQHQNDVNAQQHDEVKRSLGISQTVDNVKSSQDNEFINIGRDQNEDKNQDQDQNKIVQDQNQNVQKQVQVQGQQIQYKQEQPKKIATYESKKQQNQGEQEQEIKYTNQKEQQHQQPQVLQKQNEKQIEYVQNVQVVESVDFTNNEEKQETQQNQQQKENEQNSNVQEQDKQQIQPQEQQDQQTNRQIKPKETGKGWWEESESSKIQTKQITEHKQNQGEKQQQQNKNEDENQKQLEDPSEDLSSIKNQPNNQSKSQDPNSNLLSLDNSHTEQNKQESQNQHEEEQGKGETVQKPQTLTFLKQDPSNNIQQIESFELINSKTSGLGNTDRDNENKQQNNQNNQNNDGELLRDIEEIKQDVRHQLKNVNSIQYKLIQSQSIKSKDSQDIRDQINNARLVESKMDVPEEQQHHQHDQEQVQTVKTSNLQIDTNIQTSNNEQSKQKIEVIQSVEGSTTAQTAQIIQTGKEHGSSQIIQVPSQIKKIQILIVSANILRNTEWLGKMSPFVTILYNGWQQNTEVADKAGNVPEWNDAREFNYDEQISALTFQMYDKETFKNDDLIGQATLSLKDLNGKKTIELFFQEQLAAQLTIQLTIK